MNQLLKIILFLGIVLQTANANKRPPKLICSENEIHLQCKNKCDGTCDNPNVACTDQCDFGESCECKADHVRNEKGDCIPISECPRTCPRNEHLIHCANTCEATCENLTPFCTKECMKGSACTCNDGFVRHNGKCIRKKNCPKCEENEAYDSCGSACPRTCENLNSIGLACTLQCVPGCFCKAGYVKNDDGRCVLESECSSSDLVCSENEVHTNCNNTCDGTCDNPNIACTEECDIGEACACKPGHVRNEKGDCIPLSECPKTCPKNEHLNHCGNTCEPTCENLKPICTLDCWPGSACICNVGFVRHNGKCIRQRNCPKCEANEEFISCGSACPGTCNNPTSFGIACTKQCVVGCFCKIGHVRDGDCVPLSECPPCVRDPESGVCIESC